jgi:hypothetical protein
MGAIIMIQHQEVVERDVDQVNGVKMDNVYVLVDIIGMEVIVPHVPEVSIGMDHRVFVHQVKIGMDHRVLLVKRDKYGKIINVFVNHIKN